MRSRRPHGFTLVELLVVIGIISVLISFLLPALYRARDRAGTIACLAQARNLGLGFVMYNNDWKGKYPLLWYWHASGAGPGEFGWNSPDFCCSDPNVGTAIFWTWKDGIHPYVKSLKGWQCPRQQYLTQTIGGQKYTVAGYAMNASLAGGPNPFQVFETSWQNNWWVSISKIKNKANKVVIACTSEGVRNDGYVSCGYPMADFYGNPPHLSLPDQWCSWPLPGYYVQWQKHNSGCPVIFVDSHGEILKGSDNFGVIGPGGPGAPGDVDKWLDVTK